MFQKLIVNLVSVIIRRMKYGIIQKENHEKDIRTGKIEEIMLIRSPEDLEKFKEIYEITEEIAKEY